MTDLFSTSRPPKKAKSFLETARTVATFALLILAVAFAGVKIGDIAEKQSIDYRTAEETEVHKVLGHPFIHLGDNKPVDRVKLGTAFFVHNEYIKAETCSVSVSNVFWGADNHISHHYSMFTNWFKAGQFEANEVFLATDYLPPGKYRIVKKTVSVCNGREHYSLNFDVPVEFYR